MSEAILLLNCWYGAGVTVKHGLWTGLDWTGLDWICACALKYCYSCSIQLYTTSLNMDVVVVSSDSECESEVIRLTSAVVFTPTKRPPSPYSCDSDLDDCVSVDPPCKKR